MAKPFNPDSDQLTMKVVTGKYPYEERGTMSRFGVPDKVEPSPGAIAVWKAELQKNSLPETGMLALTITPPAHAPVGEYKLSAGLKAEENELAELFVLFNPWCSEDWVFLPNEAERQEYVMNQHGIIYQGFDQYIHGLSWDFGQFEEDMVQICLKLLDLSRKHKRDPADDVSARCNPIYVGRVVTNMVKRDGSKVEMFSDTKSVGQHISTKAVGSDERVDITNTYKHTEGSAMERAVFRYALSRLDINNTKPTDGNAAPQLIIKFEEESTPVNGQDVKMKLVLRSEGSSARTLSIAVSVQAMTYTGRLKENIKNEVIEKELLPGNDLTVPIQVPYSSYSKQMVSCQTMNISALITDIQNNQIYVADDRVVLKDPPISFTVPDEARVDQKMTFKVDFNNPVNETLTGFTLTVSGTGLVQSEEIIKVPDLMSYNTLSMKFSLFPYKSGEKTLLVDFDCASFRDIKASCTVNVKP